MSANVLKEQHSANNWDTFTSCLLNEKNKTFNRKSFKKKFCFLCKKNLFSDSSITSSGLENILVTVSPLEQVCRFDLYTEVSNQMNLMSY